MYVVFKNMDTIDKSKTTKIVATLSATAMLGLIIMCFLPKPSNKEGSEENKVEENIASPLNALVKTGKLFVTRNMMLISITSFYTGPLIREIPI